MKKLYKGAGVAQLVEQLICNQQVAGSSPVASSNFDKSRLFLQLAFVVLLFSCLKAFSRKVVKKKMSDPKIKIFDSTAYRNKLEDLYCTTEQKIIAKWAINLSKYIFSMIDFDYNSNEIITSSFSVNEAWQNGNARMHDVRQAGFKVHALARSEKNEILKTALRVAGQAIGTGHMKEHALVASDYAVKVVNLLKPNSIDDIIDLRKWQIDKLNEELALS